MVLSKKIYAYECRNRGRRSYRLTAAWGHKTGAKIGECCLVREDIPDLFVYWSTREARANLGSLFPEKRVRLPIWSERIPGFFTFSGIGERSLTMALQAVVARQRQVIDNHSRKHIDKEENVLGSVCPSWAIHSVGQLAQSASCTQQAFTCLRYGNETPQKQFFDEEQTID